MVLRAPPLAEPVKCPGGAIIKPPCEMGVGNLEKGGNIMKMNDTQIKWIDGRDAVFPIMEMNTLRIDEHGTRVTEMLFNERISFGDGDNKSEYPKWEIFAYLCRKLTQHIKEEFNITTDEDFVKYYNKITADSEYNKIMKSCYGIVLMLRHWLEHHVGEVKDNTFSYKDKNGDDFVVKLSTNGIMLLREIAEMIISKSCGIPTEKHFADLLRSRYLMLYQYLSRYGKYVNPKRALIEVNPDYKLAFGRRTLVKNPSTEIDEENGIIRIKDTVKTHYYWEGVDYLVDLDKQKYIIPGEILHNGGIRKKNLKGWKMRDNHTHGTVLQEDSYV